MTMITRYYIAKNGLFQKMPYEQLGSEPEQSLWRAIIDLALHDLGADNVKIREDAEVWFDMTNPDFVSVCELAFIDPKKVLDFYENNATMLRNRLIDKRNKGLDNGLHTE